MSSAKWRLFRLALYELNITTTHQYKAFPAKRILHVGCSELPMDQALKQKRPGSLTDRLSKPWMKCENTDKV